MKQATYIPALRFDWLTRFYDPVLQVTMREDAFKSSLINRMNLQAGQQVLDFGCGTLTLSLMAKQKHPLVHITGVDVDEKVMAIAREKLAGKPADIQADMQLDLYDGSVLPYADNTFDKAMSSLVFHHLTAGQKAGALSEIRRVLKPGGEIHIADWGKPATGLMRSAFYLVQLLDGFKTTTDNVKGRLPGYIREARFTNITETGYFNTVFGTVRLIKALK